MRSPTTSESTQVRWFSLVVSLVVMVVMACTWAWRGIHDPSLLAFGVGDQPDRKQFPWEAADPGAVTWSGDTMSGPAGSSVLRLDAAYRPTQPLAMTDLSRGSDVKVYVYDGTPPTNHLLDVPRYLGFLGSSLPTVLPDGEKGLTLWFSADTAWTVAIAPLEATPLYDHVSGRETNTYLHYVGPGGPHLLRIACSSPPDDATRDTYMSLYAYTSANGSESLAYVRCPGETTVWQKEVPTVLNVVGGYDTEWTLTLDQDASYGPEPSPGG